MRRLSSPDLRFHIFAFIFLFLAGIVVLYPLIYVVACSFSSSAAIYQGRVFLWPADFSFRSYTAIFNYPLLLSGFLNSIVYVAGGTVIAVSLILLAGYPMSRKDMPDRKIILTFYVITMFFGGGIIPSYILMRNLHLVGTRWALIIGAGFSCYNMIIVRTYFQTSVPLELLDAAHIDGCGDARFFFSVALPLATPVIAVMVLFNAVGIWNSYFNGMMYLTKPDTYSFQMVLRDILFIMQMPPEMMEKLDPRQAAEKMEIMAQLRYSLLVIGAVPMMILYPFIQKYFIRGMMIGSIKE